MPASGASAHRNIKPALIACGIVLLAVPGADLIIRLSAASQDLQAIAPSLTSFIGLLLAASEFTIAAVFIAFSLFVPGTRWARFWAIYHFITAISASYHGTHEFWLAWRPWFAALDAVGVACVAGGVEEYVGRRAKLSRLALLAVLVWAAIQTPRWYGLYDGGMIYLAYMMVANFAGAAMIFSTRRGYAANVVAGAVMLYGVMDLSGILHEAALGIQTLSFFPVILNTTAGLVILLAALFEYQRQIEAGRAGSERARVALTELAASLERRTVEYASERDRAQSLAAAANENRERLQLLLEHAPASLAMFDRNMNYLAVSRRWLADHSLGDRDVLGRSCYEVLPEAPAHWRSLHARGLEGEVSHLAEDRVDRSDGTPRWLQLDVRPWRTASGEIGGTVIFSEDVTERKNVENEMRIAATAFESQEGIVVTDPAGIILRVNQAFTRLTGYPARDVIGMPVGAFGSNESDPSFHQGLLQALARVGYWQGELWEKRRDGSPFVGWVTISAVKGPGQATTHYVGAFADISHNKEAEAQIHRLAYYDPLTQLPNRRLLQDRIAQIMASGRRGSSYGGLVFLDLDNFKVLNDTRGHDVGDELLVEAARRIQSNVRGRDTVARLGGDEFVVVLEDLGVEAQGAALHAGAVGEKLRQSLAQPYEVGSRRFHCPASLGVALFRGDEDSVETVLKHADLAMYQAKSAGRNTLRFFDPAMQTALDERSALESDLRLAVELGQLELYYQPQLDGAGRIVGAEALLRWQHRERGMVPPGDFIPLAEETGLILGIGRWVLETACAQIRDWASVPAGRDLRLAVNVSARQFRQPDFVATVRHLLTQAGADPSRLKIEITESVVLDDLGDTFAKMNELKSLGVSFSLDDFGTGNSSLSYLSKLPLNELKIDKSFVLNLPDNRNDAIIAQTIITMATSLGLDVTAEGVETEAQRIFLVRHGCNTHQGYLFSRPLPLRDFEQFLARGGQRLKAALL